MKKSILALIFSIVATLNIIYSQCNTKQPKILLVGDSWAFLPNGFNTIDKVFDQYGFSDYEDFSSGTLSVNGKKTKYLLDSAVLDEIQQAFINNPTIEFINISIGGNDLLRGWNKNMTATQRDSVIDKTIQNKDSLVRLLKAMKPDIKIYFPQYDFPNFGEAIEAYAPFQDQHPFYDAWDDMGQPTFLEINTALLAYDAKMLAFVNLHPQVDYFSASGLMQNIYGQNTPLTIAPGGTYPPDSVPVPGGYPSYPSPLSAMNDYGLFYDAFHLGDNAYTLFYDFHFQQYYWKELRKRDFTTKGSSNDGSVTNTNVNSSYISFGMDSSNNLTKGIVEFNTSGIPASKIPESGAIFIKRTNLIDSNPIHGKILIEIKSGRFGTLPTLELVDFNATADIIDTACVYGSVSNNKSWLRIDIPNTLMPYINKSGMTQFRFTTIDTTIGELFFTTGLDSNYKPELDIKYQEFASINDKHQSALKIYPNPTHDNITILSEEALNGTVTIADLAGKTLRLPILRNNINTSSLVNGRYIITDINNKRTHISFIKIH